MLQLNAFSGAFVWFWEKVQWAKNRCAFYTVEKKGFGKTNAANIRETRALSGKA